MIRIKAILYAFWYGILPSYWYEEKKHYDCSYREHLVQNIKYALRWLLYEETSEDIDFEKRVNNNGSD